MRNPERISSLATRFNTPGVNPAQQQHKRWSLKTGSQYQSLISRWTVIKRLSQANTGIVIRKLDAFSKIRSEEINAAYRLLIIKGGIIHMCIGRGIRYFKSAIRYPSMIQSRIFLLDLRFKKV